MVLPQIYTYTNNLWAGLQCRLLGLYVLFGFFGEPSLETELTEQISVLEKWEPKFSVLVLSVWFSVLSCFCLVVSIHVMSNRHHQLELLPPFQIIRRFNFVDT